MHEFELIEKYFAPISSEGALGLKDDAALLDVPAGQKLVITTDTLNEGVHFKASTAPDKIAQKALRVNLSDLAAMGAKALGYTLNLSFAEPPNSAFIAAFCEGLKHDQNTFQVSLLGGDTTRTNGPLSITITAYGLTDRPLLRSGAKLGDAIYVSGAIGAGYLGLHEHCTQTIAHYECPEPRLALGQHLRGVASACMDISDGFVQDLRHLCAASGVGAEVLLSAIPLADAFYDVTAQITGGDDYELLFTAPKNAQIPAGATRVGQITGGKELRLLDADGSLLPMDQGGWQHF
jgi:thiamine-monophosphate kinase